MKEFVVELKEKKGQGGVQELQEEVIRLREEVEELKSKLGKKESEV